VSQNLLYYINTRDSVKLNKILIVGEKTVIQRNRHEDYYPSRQFLWTPFLFLNKLLILLGKKSIAFQVINLEEFRKSLGKFGNKMAEDKIIELRELEDKVAEVIFKQWLRDKDRFKQPTETPVLWPKTMLK